MDPMQVETDILDTLETMTNIERKLELLEDKLDQLLTLVKRLCKGGN